MIDAEIRRQVRERADYRCEYCRLPQAAAPYLTFHIEHIQASQHVQDDRLENLCLACPHCNLNKGPNLTTLDPETREIISLFHPRKHAWEAHFRFEDAHIEGRTSTGRATARLLKRNAEDLVRIRAALMQRGEF